MSALESLTSDLWDGGAAVDDWLEQSRQHRLRMQQIREQSDHKARKKALQDRLGLEPEALDFIQRLERIKERNPVRAVKVFTHAVTLAKIRGLDLDVEIDEDADRPVMDQTKTARRMVGFRSDSRANYGSRQKNAFEQERDQIAGELYEKLVNGIPENRLREGYGGGRPSNAWQAAFQVAVERFEREHMMEAAQDA